MEKIVDYALQYPLVLGGVVVFLLFLCWKSEEVRGWVVRIVVFLLVLALLFFAFQKFKYLIPSSSAPPGIRDDSLQEEDHAGKKYYSDPDERLKEAE